MLARIYSFFQPKGYKKVAPGCEKVLTLQNSVRILEKYMNLNMKPRQILGKATKFRKIWMSH